MVASLQDTSLEEECFTQALQQQESRNTAAALPLSHEAAMKWFYKDPQGEIQGTLGHQGAFLPLKSKSMRSTTKCAKLTCPFPLFLAPTRSVHHSGDVRVVPGRLLHHDPSGKAGL